jgi:synaptobrevin family protein YKT6
VTLIVATQDYQSRVAYGILREIMREYDTCAGIFPNGKSSVLQRGICEDQQPRNADKITRIQENLEETQAIMTKNLQLALMRQETLEELLEKSQIISAQARMFTRESEKLNGCCSRT